MNTEWPTKTLGELLSFLTSGSRGWREHYRESGDLFLRIQNVGRNKMLLDDVAFVTAPDTVEARRTLVQSGDVLLSITADLGRTGVVPDGIGRAYINQHLAILRVQNVHPHFLSAFLASPEGQNQIMGRNRQAVKAGLNFEDIRSFQIPLPPLEEQRRIAKVLDQADALRTKRRAAAGQLDSLTQSLFLDLFGDPINNPKGLPITTLGEIARFVGGGTPSRAVPAYYEGALCWATSKDMKGEVLRDTQEHITERAIEESATNLVEAGTILVVVKSKILMHHLPVLIASVPTCFGQDLKGIILNQPWPSRYVARHLRLGQKWLLNQARGANTEGLTLDHLRGFPILVPPPTLAERYEKIEQTIELQSERMNRSLTKLDALFASLQHRAFRGGL